ncbi:IS3 family transposase [Niabella agricola]|uniref:IS3 family transposase n=1 Tax=Niabella agricola TaxID=2891571 RepID=UPI001F3B3E36|nr:IS3 family transposase [Niabella agricola]
MCACFAYSRSAYYKSLKACLKARFKSEQVLDLVMAIRRDQPMIGGKKLYWLLREGLAKSVAGMGRDKFFEILRKRGLLVKRTKKYVRTTDSYHRFYKYKNELRDRVLTGPNQAFVSDITYLRTEQGFLYLFLQMDAWSRKITGWHLSNSLAIEGAVAALKMSLKQCAVTKGVIHHSDRGIQYCCGTYVSLLQKAGMEISMTEQNHCYENACAERVNGILKQEFLLDRTFDNQQEALRAVREAICTYNYRRPHWSLKLAFPAQIHQAA